MNVVIIDKDRYIFLDTELPEIRDKLQDLSDAINKMIDMPDDVQQAIPEICHEIFGSKEGKTERVVDFETSDGNITISVSDIVSIEVYGNNCTVYTKNSKYRLKRGSLESKLKEIGDSSIIRCHKSYGINVRWVERLEKKSRNLWEPVYCGGVDVPCLISKTYFDRVRDSYLQFHHSDEIAGMQR